ncbi:MAG: NERD domain-containing protein, partial [Anaerolineae bacterium]
AREGRRESALLRLRAYVQAHPEDADAWVVLGKLAPDHKIALSALRRAVQLAPENATARDALTELEAQVVASPQSAAVEASPVEIPADLVVPTVPPLETETEKVIEFSAASKPKKDARLDIVQQPETEATSVVGRVEESAEVGLAQDTEFRALREARAIIWPFTPRRKKKRTLGALLDENRLTRQDLLWASQEARNEDVRKASQVILETTHRLTDVAMSPEDARLMAWPFRRLNRPLGKLVDTGTVKVKDLRRAAWYAKDARLREAARVMLPVALKRREAEKRKQAAQKLPQDGAPPKQEGNATPASAVQASTPGRSEHTRTVPDDAMTRPMPVIQGSNYLVNEVQRRYRRNLFITAIMLILVLAGLMVALALIVTAVVSHKAPALWLWPLVAVLLLPLFALSDRFVELRQEELNFRRGQLGESEVARLLRLGLGDDWALFRNVKLPGSTVDIDMVLLGPPGAFALEVKAYTGNYRYTKKRFYRRTMMTWRRMQHNPGKQARAAAGLLHSYITNTLNEDIWVEPRLVWVGPGNLMLEEPEVFVWFIAKLDQETERLRALSRKLSTEKRTALSGLLRGLCSTLR